MAEEKRGVATITLYVWGDNDQELLNEAKRYEDILKQHGDNHARVEKLHDAPFGSIGDQIKEIDLYKLDHDPDVKTMF